VTGVHSMFRRVFLRQGEGRRAVRGPLAIVAIGIIAFSFLAVTGSSAKGADAPVSSNPADIAAGLQLYDAHCQSCHGTNGVGGANGSPELIDAGAAAADFYISTGRMPLNNPHDQAIRHHPYFNAEQTRQLVAYIADLPAINGKNVSGPGIPVVAPLCTSAGVPAGCTTLTEGQQYFQVNCAQCHQAVGSGGMLSKGNLIPSLHNASTVQVAEAMRVGPKPMPVFGTGQLSDHQVSAIANYVQYLHNPTNRGGLGLSHFGPVAEGFVGIVVGLGAILIVSRLMGNRG
jgi:ubiquinol-cytochrome c reductase cytochrome c subunit